MNPYGTQTTTWDGDTPTLTQTLSPEELAIYRQNAQNRLGLGQLGQQGIQSVQGTLGTGLDLGGAGDAPGAYNPMQTPEALDLGGLLQIGRNYSGAQGLDDLASSEALRSQIIAAQMQRGEEDLGERQEQIESDLRARGIMPGTKAYEREIDRLTEARNDLRLQAENTAGSEVARQAGIDQSRRAQLYGEQTNDANLMFGQDMASREAQLAAQNQRFNQQGQAGQFAQSQQAQQFGQLDSNRRQAIAEIMARRQIPLNEIIGLTSGSQVQNPFNMPGYAQNSQVAPAPIFGAAQAQDSANMGRYQNQQSGFNNMMSGLFGIGAAAAGRKW